MDLPLRSLASKTQVKTIQEFEPGAPLTIMGISFRQRVSGQGDTGPAQGFWGPIQCVLINKLHIENIARLVAE